MKAIAKKAVFAAGWLAITATLVWLAATYENPQDICDPNSTAEDCGAHPES